jgi:hypothetical protein
VEGGGTLEWLFSTREAVRPEGAHVTGWKVEDCGRREQGSGRKRGLARMPAPAEYLFRLPGNDLELLPFSLSEPAWWIDEKTRSTQSQRWERSALSASEEVVTGLRPSTHRGCLRQSAKQLLQPSPFNPVGMKKALTDGAKGEAHRDVAIRKRDYRMTLIFSMSPRNVSSSPSMRTR